MAIWETCMDGLAICQSIENSPLGILIRQANWIFPVIETIHLFGIVALVGSTSALDLRLLGVALREQPVSKLARRLLPWAWGGFAVQVVTGSLLFASEATRCYTNTAFRIKMVLIALAGINALVFHITAYRSVSRWDNSPVSPMSARVAGTFSILLWFGVVAAGRWIAFL